MPNLTIAIDERLRLVTAVLAASRWPDDEQKQLTHAVHPQAKLLRQFVEPFRSHPAALGINAVRHAGISLSELFSAAGRCTWPEFKPTMDLPGGPEVHKWVQTLANFATETAVSTEFFPLQKAVWDEAVSALQKIFSGDGLLTSLAQMQADPLDTAVTLMPNLAFPALSPAAALTGAGLTLLLPPPKAVGESPPWPFDEDPGWVVATVAEQLTTHLLAAEFAQLEVGQRPLATHLTIAHCLAQLLDDFEAQAYLLRAKKEHKLPQLSGLFVRLQSEIAAGNGRPLNTLFTN